MEKYITCPHCGTQYLLEEIFMEEDLIGKRYNIIKDNNGKIISMEGCGPSMHEDYCCDNCGCNFRVEASLDFTTSEIKDDFEEESVTQIYKDRIKLDS